MALTFGKRTIRAIQGVFIPQSVDADGDPVTDSSGNPASNVVLGDSGAAVGPAVTVAAAPDTNDECHTMPFTSTANTDELNASPTETTANGLVAGDIIRCYADQDCYIRFDDAATAADTSSMYFSAGTELIKIPDGVTHISVVRVSADGTLYITKVS